MTPPPARATWSWIIYDLANTIFALGVIGFYFPAWLTEEGLADSWLALVEAGAGITVVFLAPWVGARSDALGRRLPALMVTTVIAVAGTMLLGVGPMWLPFLALAVALVAFNTGSVVYDALLPIVSTPSTRGSVSGMGVGIGYIGSFVGLGIGILALDVWQLGYPATFRLLATGFLLFSIPAFVFIREPLQAARPLPSIPDVASRLIRSWRLAATFPGMIRFLVGRFLYTDAINTLIGGFLAIYAIQELGLDSSQTQALLAAAIAAAIPGSILAGRAVQKFGALTVLRITLVGWIVALSTGVVAGIEGNVSLAWLLGPLGGASLGATWTADRVLMLELSPPAHLGEMYGLYATVGRFATILGPLVWALIVDGFGLQRTWALGTLALFVTAGLIVLGGLGRAVRSAVPRPRS